MRTIEIGGQTTLKFADFGGGCLVPAGSQHGGGADVGRR